MAIECPRLKRLLSACALHKLRGVHLTPSKITYGLCRVPFSSGHFGESTSVKAGLAPRVLTTPVRLVRLSFRAVIAKHY